MVPFEDYRLTSLFCRPTMLFSQFNNLNVKTVNYSIFTSTETAWPSDLFGWSPPEQQIKGDWKIDIEKVALIIESGKVNFSSDAQ